MIKDGVKTTEFWLSALSTISLVLLPQLLAMPTLIQGLGAGGGALVVSVYTLSRMYLKYKNIPVPAVSYGGDLSKVVATASTPQFSAKDIQNIVAALDEEANALGLLRDHTATLISDIKPPAPVV